MSIVVRQIVRMDAELVAVLGASGVATVHEARNRTGLMRPYMRPIYPAPRVAGPAVTFSAIPATT